MSDSLTHRETLQALVRAHELLIKDLLKLIAGQVNREPHDKEVMELAHNLCERWDDDPEFRKDHRSHGAAVHRLLEAQYDLVKQMLVVEDVLIASIEGDQESKPN